MYRKKERERKDDLLIGIYYKLFVCFIMQYLNNEIKYIAGF